MKKLWTLLFIGFLISCQEDTSAPTALLNFVPPNTAVILKTNNISEFRKAVTENSFIQQNKNIPVFKNFRESFLPFENLQLEEESLLCFTKVGRKDVAITLITKTQPNLIETDSVQNKKVETFTYDNYQIKKYTLEDKQTFSTQLDQIFVYSNSKLTLENIIRVYNNKLPPPEALQEIYAASTSGKATVFLANKNAQEILENFSPNKSTQFITDFSDWSALDLEIQADGIKLYGVTKSAGTDTRLLDVFKGIKTQNLQTADITPLNASGFFAFGYNNFEKLQQNLAQYRQAKVNPVQNEALFNSIVEVGIIYRPNKNAVVLRSLDQDITKESLLAHQNTASSFRGKTILEYTDTNIQQAFNPLIHTKNIKYYTQIDEFFVFAEEIETIENIIANYQNGTLLGQQAYYKNVADKLTDESSMLFMGINNNLKDVIATSVASEKKKAYQQLDFSNYDLSVLQLVYDTNFAHVNAILEKAEAGKAPEKVLQVKSIKLPNDLSSHPYLLENWRNKEKNIVIQDEENVLYVYDFDGNLRWKKELESRINGPVKEIDIYNNGRIQFVFTTQNKFHIYAVNGTRVKPFPVPFNDPITQPLSIFDYANNSKYRFVVTQNNRLYMLNKEASRVKGFTFEKAAAPITQAPKHIRIGSKDYIVFPLENGKLHILNRTGDTRIKVDQKIDFSENEWFLNNGKFTSTTAGGDLIQIDQAGKISKEKFGLTENHNFLANQNTKVSFSENTLKINKAKAELDFGLYTEPQLHEIGKSTYISITDLQTSKVYVFDTKANLLPGFPVYGNSKISMGNIDNRGNLEFVVKGEDNSVLMYEIQ